MRSGKGLAIMEIGWRSANGRWPSDRHTCRSRRTAGACLAGDAVCTSAYRAPVWPLRLGRSGATEPTGHGGWSSMALRHADPAQCLGRDRRAGRLWQARRRVGPATAPVRQHELGPPVPDALQWEPVRIVVFSLIEVTMRRASWYGRQNGSRNSLAISTLLSSSATSPWKTGRNQSPVARCGRAGNGRLPKVPCFRTGNPCSSRHKSLFESHGRAVPTPENRDRMGHWRSISAVASVEFLLFLPVTNVICSILTLHRGSREKC
jgi:hypothetical protein